MIRIGIIGASGYTGVELVRILSRHAGVEMSVVTSRQHAGKPFTQIFPSLKSFLDLSFEEDTPENLASRADLFFTAVPHQTAMAIVPHFLEANKKVIDLSADFRIHDIAVYEKWYQKHTADAYLNKAVYGLPELHRDAIRHASLVANPGCYPTSVLLAVAPLLQHNLIDADSIIIDSKSGVSGAGRGAQLGSLYCESADGFRAYKVTEHRHTPEIEQEISLLAGKQTTVSFTPHLVPMSRGILSTIYAQALQPLNDDDLIDQFREFYRNDSFVRICDRGCFPATQYVRGGNFCDIGLRYDPRTGRVVIVSVIDNLVKGAAGQAVQNMNILCGFDETMGLEIAPLFP